MLLRFSVTNFRSIKDRQELSLIGSSLDGPTDGLIDTRHAPGKRVLPVAVVYGANASGKSNLVRALRWMRDVVIRSHARGGPDDPIPRHPFALDDRCLGLPTTFDIDFVIDDVRYHYGFMATSSVFAEEWLHAFPNERRQTLFERAGQTFTFGRSLKGRNHTISELTRSNSLLLSSAAQNGHEELTNIARFFREQQFPRGASAPVRNALPDQRVADFLKSAGTGVAGFRFKELNMPDAAPPEADKFPEIAKLFQAVADLRRWAATNRTDVEIDTAPSSLKILQMEHRGGNGQLAYFDYHDESEGTRRLIDLLPAVFQALDTGSLVVIDELDASLHTKAGELLLGLFASRQTNPRGAQLVATTHDTNLLRSPLLRRDQIWLTEKDPEGATHLYPITDFRTRKTDNLERGYLEGRFGAVPFAGDARDVLSTL